MPIAEAPTPPPDSAADTHESDIVQIAASNDDFETLVAAVQAAGLVETLKGDGPFTVFAPTDDAFAKLGHSTLDDLLKPSNRDQLTAILTYHVVPGRVTSHDLADRRSLTTVNGQKISVGVGVENARFVATDISASNGVIHVIDTVLLPR
ncbi:MAG: fasciclin domain-containing protein [Bacteroidota bacterium]